MAYRLEGGSPLHLADKMFCSRHRSARDVTDPYEIAIGNDLEYVIYDFRALPFDTTPVFLASGLTQTVFTLDTPTEKRILKVDKPSLGLGNTALIERARYLRDQYAQIERWFATCQGLIPPLRVLLLRAHLQYGRDPSRPVVKAIASMQPFIDDGIGGVFEDFSITGLAELLSVEPTLKHTFTLTTRTIRDLAEKDIGADILGARNLVVAGTEGAHRLVFLDPSPVFSPSRLIVQDNEKFYSRVRHLEEVLDLADTLGPE